MRYRMIVSDIDGTLLNAERNLSPLTKETLKKVISELGIPFVLASSRMPKAMRYFLEELTTDQFLISYNGALIQHPKKFGKDLTLFSDTIPFSTMAAIVAACIDMNLHISLYRNDEWFTEESDQWSAREQKNTRSKPNFIDMTTLVEMWQIKNMGPHKIMVMGHQDDVDIVEALLAERAGNIVSLYRSKPSYLEIASKTTDKSDAVAMISTYLGIPMSEVVAFGDNVNDIDMILQSGLGVAVGNAHDQVKVAANKIVKTNHEDGVALAIQEIFGFTV